MTAARGGGVQGSVQRGATGADGPSREESEPDPVEDAWAAADVAL